MTPRGSRSLARARCLSEPRLLCSFSLRPRPCLPSKVCQAPSLRLQCVTLVAADASMRVTSIGSKAVSATFVPRIVSGDSSLTEEATRSFFTLFLLQTRMAHSPSASGSLWQGLTYRPQAVWFWCASCSIAHPRLFRLAAVDVRHCANAVGRPQEVFQAPALGRSRRVPHQPIVHDVAVGLQRHAVNCGRLGDCAETSSAALHRQHGPRRHHNSRVPLACRQSCMHLA